MVLSPLAALTSARTVSLLRSISVCECACINQCMRMRVVYWVSSERYGISNISGLLAVGSRSRFALCLFCRAVFPLWEGGGGRGTRIYHCPFLREAFVLLLFFKP